MRIRPARAEDSYPRCAARRPNAGRRACANRTLGPATRPRRYPRVQPSTDAQDGAMQIQRTAAQAAAVAIAARIPVLLWGAPGTGKTSMIRSLAAAADLPCETVIASIREPA